MKRFLFEGEEWRSLRQFCEAKRISYAKLCRLRRHFLRAKEDPVVAIRWLLGLEPLSYLKEPMTADYTRDMLKRRMRHLKD